MLVNDNADVILLDWELLLQNVRGKDTLPSQHQLAKFVNRRAVAENESFPQRPQAAETMEEL